MRAAFLSIISVFLYDGACVCEEDLVSFALVRYRSSQLAHSRILTSLLAITHFWNFFFFFLLATAYSGRNSKPSILEVFFCFPITNDYDAALLFSLIMAAEMIPGAIRMDRGGLFG